MIITLLIGVLAFVFVAAAMAPMESMSWWAGWGPSTSNKESLTADDATSTAAQAGAEAEADLYVVYLSGIGAISGVSIPEEEMPLLEGLAERVPNAKVIHDVFPYSVTNNGLTGQRAFAGLWRWIEKLRFKNPNTLLGFIINGRNTFQVFVSADKRYGPVYNLGIAQEIAAGLLRHGYRLQSHKPVVLLGWSGGGQISIGSAAYLSALGAPIYVVSLGGLLSDDVGLDYVTHLGHFYGDKDIVQGMGPYLFPGRWKSAVTSTWNRAKAAGKFTFVDLGPYVHNGKGNYFDYKTLLPDDTRSFGEKTLETIVTFLVDEGLAKPAAPAQQHAPCQ